MEQTCLTTFIRSGGKNIAMNIDADAKQPEKYYPGDYEATPSNIEQTLNTGGYLMREDFDILPVPYAEVTNEKGGYTVTIGG